MEIELLKSKEQSQVANKAKTDFLAIWVMKLELHWMES
jgi:hypothetical protein